MMFVVVIVVIAMALIGIGAASARDGEDFIPLILIVMMIGIAFTAFAAGDKETLEKKIDSQSEVICKLKGGEMVDDLCINGKVVKIK